MHIESMTDSIKTINQDSLLIKEGILHRKHIALCVVCDGIGGLEKGEVASAYVIQELSKWMNTLRTTSLKQIEKQLKALFYEMNYKLYCSAYSMGTTISFIFFVNHSYIFCNIGDSRIYKIDKKIKQLTRDDSAMVGVLTNALGMNQNITISFHRGRIKKELILICSDGFYRRMKTDEWIRLYEFFPWQISKYIQILRVRNELDDISVIGVKWNSR